MYFDFILNISTFFLNCKSSPHFLSLSMALISFCIKRVLQLLTPCFVPKVNTQRISSLYLFPKGIELVSYYWLLLSGRLVIRRLLIRIPAPLGGAELHVEVSLSKKLNLKLLLTPWHLAWQPLPSVALFIQRIF